MDYCKKTKQNIPSDDGQIVRAVLESLAMKYCLTLLELKEFKNIDELLITGGGINNKLLCQFTANACNIPVTTTLSEGTAAGNIMAQALGAGIISSKEEITVVMANSCSPKTYLPADAEVWHEAYTRYILLMNQKKQ
jgi:sugar (pentulose or hexulose) kinase